MKNNSVHQAYQNIRPDEEAKVRMLNCILASSEIPPAGKDERKMRRKMKPLMIAAILALMIIMMGCAVVALRLPDLKISEIVFGKGEILDADGNVLREKDLAMDVISLHGYIDSPTYLAHQEWYEFYEEYSENHVITEEDSFIRPELYEAYSVYNQELIDKVDEISEKYGLKLLGAFAPFQRSERKVFYDATGLESLLVSESSAFIERESGYFYEGGNFKVEFHMTMPDSANNWPYDMLNSIYYSKSDYFDTVYYVIKDWEDWDQWDYTTASGVKLLITRAKSGYGAEIFCYREDALINLSIDGHYQDDTGETTFMTPAQLEQVAEQFDYSIKVENVDMDLAKENLERFANMKAESQKVPGKEYTDFESFIRNEIAELGERADEMYYCHVDLQDDGTEELILGTEDQVDSVWTLETGYVNLIMDWGENYRKLEEAWPDMRKQPIIEYFAE